MENRDIVALGTSAGGVQALIFLAGRLRPDFPASILVTIHLPSYARSELDQILTEAGPLPAVFASDGEQLKKGRIYLAPPDRHLLVTGERLSLGQGPRENNSRPAIDPMLRAAAMCCCGRAIGVVLTGTLGDGASGLWALKQCGGIAVVQDPNDAAFSQMPATALSRVKPDHVARLADMPTLLDRLVREPAARSGAIPGNVEYEVEMARGGRSSMNAMDRLGPRSALVCPDCVGAMWEIDEDEVVRYRCHVGHTYTAELMSLALDKDLRRALATAQRALEDRLAVARELYQQAIASGQRLLAETWADREREFEGEIEIVRNTIRRMERAVEPSRKSSRKPATAAAE